MKRRITVTTPEVRITAVITTPPDLTRREVEIIRDELADRLQKAASNLEYFWTPRNRVKVR